MAFGIAGIELAMGNWFQNNPAKRLPDLARQTGKKYEFRTYGHTGEDVKVTFYRDKFGLRGRSKEADRDQILILGGSTAIEFTVPEELTWAEQLEKRINEKRLHRKKIDVINAGINGQTLLGNRASVESWLKHIKIVRPKIVIIYYGFNDALHSIAKSKSLAKNPTEPEAQHKSFKELILVNSALAILGRELKGSYESWASNNRHLFDYKPLPLPTKMSSRSGNIYYEDKILSESSYPNKLAKLIESVEIAWPNANILFVAQSNPNCFFESYTVYKGENKKNICSDMLSIHRYTSKIISNMRSEGRKNIELIPLFLRNPYNRYESSDHIHANSLGSKKIADALFPMMTKYID